jgi:hypothetical protein
MVRPSLQGKEWSANGASDVRMINGASLRAQAARNVPLGSRDNAVSLRNSPLTAAFSDQIFPVFVFSRFFLPFA